jgi:hypothetical protein
MKMKFALVLLGICMISGCHGYGHLYPVEGPLASLTPPPIYTAKITLLANWSKPITVGAHANDRKGIFSVVLANGEQFQGPWSLTYEKAGAQSASSGVSDKKSLPAAWDTVYGQGYYVAHVLGSPLFVHAEMTGNQGTVLDVEWYEYAFGNDEAGGIASKGIAKDSKGNIYKLSF